MKVRVWLETAYDVEVATESAILAEQAVSANWDTIYRHQAKATDFPPNLSGRVLRVAARPEGSRTKTPESTG
jgi:hypothetical protein